MSAPCPECRAISLELQEAFHAARGAAPAGASRLADWIAQLDSEALARIRETSPIWKAWRRLQVHRATTGHRIPLISFPPETLQNPN